MSFESNLEKEGCSTVPELRRFGPITEPGLENWFINI